VEFVMVLTFFIFAILSLKLARFTAIELVELELLTKIMVEKLAET
jgi:hypothetical protein